MSSHKYTLDHVRPSRFLAGLKRLRSFQFTRLRTGLGRVFLHSACGFALMFSVCPDGKCETRMDKPQERIVRKALGAGRWFPGDKENLRRIIDKCIENAGVEKINGTIVGAVAPHAGYLYSGKVAGYTFRALKENAAAGHKPETVVVLGLSHRGGFPGVALMDGDAIETPLGEAILDREAGEALAAQSPWIFFDYSPHAGEHSAENEIPFVQVALPGAKILVGLIGDHDPRILNDLIAALGDLSKKKKIVVIASSDMLHDPDHALVAKIDRETLKKIRAMDKMGIRKDWTPHNQILCGIAPVLAVMGFAEQQGCKKGTILYYRNSGDDFPASRGRWVVGYGSVIFAVPE